MRRATPYGICLPPYQNTIGGRHPTCGLDRLSSIYQAMWLVPGEQWYLVGVGIYHR